MDKEGRDLKLVERFQRGDIKAFNNLVTQWEFSELIRVIHFQDSLQNIREEGFDAIRRGFYDLFENPVKEHFY